MAKLKKVGQALVLTSALKVEEIKKVLKFAPKALELTEEKEVKFKMGLNQMASANQYGVLFNTEDTEGFAQFTQMTNLKTKEEVLENFGVALSNLNAVEVQVKNALADVYTVFTAVEGSIEVE